MKMKTDDESKPSDSFSEPLGTVLSKRTVLKLLIHAVMGFAVTGLAFLVCFVENYLDEPRIWFLFPVQYILMLGGGVYGLLYLERLDKYVSRFLDFTEG